MLIIHCTDSREDDPNTSRNEEMDIGVAEIEEWHKKRAEKEPWSFYKDPTGAVKYIGYHFVVKRNGTVETGRPINEVGCHAKGVNKSSIGICWVGKSKMTDKQKESLITLVAVLCISHGLETIDVYGHNQFSTHKTCPNFNSVHTFESIEHFRNMVEMAIRELK